MKNVILLGDGMADNPIKELSGKTPLEVAHTPHMDRLTSKGDLGLVRTVKPGFPPGSDIANMSVLGLDPSIYYTGRAPIEAVSMGVTLEEGDLAFRINLVTLSPRKNGLIMEDYCAGHISSQEASELIDALKDSLKQNPEIRLYHGIEYRHLMVIKGYNSSTKGKLKTIPPHDITGEYVEKHLPTDALLKRLIQDSSAVLKDHKVNINRRRQGKREATAIWPWGEGKACAIPTLQEEYGISGAIISAVDLLKGLGMLRGMEIIDVPGATGWIDTNYTGKAHAALDALTRVDLVYVHVEAPDEASHGGLIKEKIGAIEAFDRMVVGTIITGLESQPLLFKVLLMPDHPTPIATRTHSSDPVPFAIYDSTNTKNNNWRFSEKDAKKAGLFIEEGHTILKKFLES